MSKARDQSQGRFFKNDRDPVQIDNADTLGPLLYGGEEKSVPGYESHMSKMGERWYVHYAHGRAYCSLLTN
jgi:hypothetical protein